MQEYKKLREVLDSHFTGAPEAEEFEDILKILFTPDEARVAAGMLFVPGSVDEISEASGIDPEEVEKCCESMANKGIIFSRDKRGVMGYALLPTIPGIYEFPFMRGEDTPEHKRLALLWKEYYKKGMGREFGSSKTPVGRVIPLEKSLDSSLEILPYEVISKMFDRAKTFAVAECACRVSMDACDKIRDVCLLFDASARFLIDRNFAKEITREEAEETLLRAEEAGLLHTTNNSQDRLTFLCNCCTCCCTIVKGLTQLKNPNAFAKSGWLAHVDQDECTGCGICEEERCPMEAISVDDGIAEVDEERCIGCGLCAGTCETEAISMVPRTEAPDTPVTISEMGVRIATEKGRLDDFLKVMKR